jgi:mycofactocin precursor
VSNLPTIDQDASATTSDVEPVAEPLAEPLVEESLVEEVSIDGMCGVY